jgi:CHAD domain-containing protein
MVMTSTASLPKERVARPKRPRHLSEAMRCETAFRLIVSECLEDVATNHDATCGGDGTALHQTRVALTRLRAAVAFYGKMVADIEWTRLKSELKWLSSHLGATRDLDVAIQNAKGTPDEGAFIAARTEAFAALKDALESERYRQWFDAMWDWVGSGPWTARQDLRAARRRSVPVAEFHARKLARWHRKLNEKSRGIQGMGKTKRHDLRLASKRLRYAIEFSEGGLPAEDYVHWRDIAKQLRKGQQILGELNDADVQRALITSLNKPAKPVKERAAKHAKLHARKKKGRMLRRAATVYRKIGG